MAHSRKRHICAAKHNCGPRPFLYVLGDGRIELIYEVRAYNVKLVRIDTDNRAYRGYQLYRSSYVSSLKGTIGFVHFLNFPDIGAPLGDIEIVLVPEGQGRQFGTREMSNRRKIKTIDDPVCGVQHNRYYGVCNKGSADLHIDKTSVSGMDFESAQEARWFLSLIFGSTLGALDQSTNLRGIRHEIILPA